MFGRKKLDNKTMKNSNTEAQKEMTSSKKSSSTSSKQQSKSSCCGKRAGTTKSCK